MHLDSRGLQTQAAQQLGEAIARSVEDSFRTPRPDPQGRCVDVSTGFSREEWAAKAPTQARRLSSSVGEQARRCYDEEDAGWTFSSRHP